ncbi:glycoside hydrolase family 2 TIM barrel-domain containing protein [Seonamhaeicola sp. ML3]|uniref:glycoside hydrolase family 2 TIM barrel-domain containing protein n=1 Tax=Seonamhaeicola sp. ML3 TaxID=2937786 RepID=UPI00200D415C|nr:glycoside hydrolase family 2 TIM barrel-domain containing protein [Seonamhaeicola sp. ML3]
MKQLLSLLLIITSISQYAQQVRHIETTNEAWVFHKGSLEKPFDNNEHITWENVTIPHSWNTADILDDENGYYRGEAWYKKTITVPQIYENQQVFLLFEAANQVASLFVNGEAVGEDHIGGYTTFARDITSALKIGKNEIVVRVDNAHDDEIVPQSADFSFYGGIYRDVQLIITKPVHFEVANLGANAIFIRTPEVSETSAKLTVQSKLVRPKKGAYYVRQSLFDADNNQVKQVKSRAIFGKDVRSEFSVTNPNLWSPKTPYLYKLVSEIVDKKGNIYDRIENVVGFRWFSFDANKGFFINGKPTKLIGTCRHQDFLGKANAVSDEIHRNDMRLLKEMGSNFLRIAHYPQDPAILEMCNKLGLVATLEIPFVNKAAANETGKQNTIKMLKEAIRFNYNHPAIVAWNLGNETTMKAPNSFGEEYTKHFVSTHEALAKTIKEEDKTRYSYSVFFREPAYQDRLGIRFTDLVGYNKYYGWYVEELEDIDKNLRNLVARSLELNPDKPFILSEYGGGADPRLRSYNPTRFDFSVDYQFLLHKYYMKTILEMPEISGANVWNYADFQVEHRKDAVPHINNKGLVSATRKKKDVYYLYQAILKETPFLAIASKSWNKRSGIADVKGGAYATQPLTIVGNGNDVELFLNGISLGKKVFEFSTVTFDVPFIDGQNLIEVISKKDGKLLKDIVFIDFNLIPRDLKSNINKFEEVAVNVGSHCYFIETDNMDYLWMPDKVYEKGGFGYIGGDFLKHPSERRNAIGTDVSVKGTENDPIYQTQRIGIEGYKFDVPNGTYELTLLLAELKTKDLNVMDVKANGKLIWKDINLKKSYGNDRGVAKRFLISVEDDKGITIEFEAKKGTTRLSGIKLRKVN